MKRFIFPSVAEIAFLIMALAGAIGTAREFWSLSKLGKSADHVIGVVVENAASRSSEDDGVTYAPVVEYSGKEGAPIRFTGSVRSNPPGFKVGEHVNVVVSKDGKVQRIGTLAQMWLPPVGGIVLTVAMGCIGLAMTASRLGKRNFAREMMARGQRTDSVDAKVVVIRSDSDDIPDRYCLECAAIVDGARRVFRSGEIGKNPAGKILGRTIAIYYLPGEPEKYHVDLDFL